MKKNRTTLLAIVLIALIAAACTATTDADNNGNGNSGNSGVFKSSGSSSGATVDYYSDNEPAADEPAANEPEALNSGNYFSNAGESDQARDAAGAPVPQALGTAPLSSDFCCSEEENPYRQPPVGNYFQSYGINKFVNTLQDPLSTFGLDVDTASYTVSRRYVQDGFLPPADAVRTEEFVNYFNQGYPNPDGAFGIFVDGAPSPFDFGETHILRIGIQGYQVSNFERKPANLVFVIDVSGSMDMENRLGLVKQSLELLVARLRSDDTVSIVAFGTRAWVVLNPTSGSNKNTIMNAIYSLHPNGSTNAEQGLQKGYQLAIENFKPRGINRVILSSDGVANVGTSTAQGLLQLIRGHANAGITLMTAGFGMGNYNDTLMEQLADNGNGSYAYIDTLEEAERLFVDELTSTLQVIALNAKVQVEMNPDIVAQYRLIGYENRQIADSEFRNDEIDAGEIGAGQTATALYSVVLYPQAKGRIATVNLRWEDPDTRQVKEIRGDFNTSDLSSSFEESNAHFQLAVMAAQYAEILRGSPWAVGVSLDSLIPHSFRLATSFLQDSDVSEFATLVSAASSMH